MKKHTSYPRQYHHDTIDNLPKNNRKQTCYKKYPIFLFYSYHSYPYYTWVIITKTPYQAPPENNLNPYYYLVIEFERNGIDLIIFT
mgnify:CR=1 FL=1|jgi:hypothetical protein